MQLFTGQNLSEPILQQRLSQFGLNPCDWTVMRLKETLFFVVHCQEPSLILLGETIRRGARIDWGALEVIDLEVATLSVNMAGG